MPFPSSNRNPVFIKDSNKRIPIRDANTNPTVRQIGYRAWVQGLVGSRFDGKLIIDWTDVQGTVQAEIQNNCWCVICPGDGCNGAIITKPGELYYCPDCCNSFNDGKVATVLFPLNVEALEDEIKNRPPSARNWLRHQSPDDIGKENQSMEKEVVERKERLDQIGRNA